MKSRAVKTKGEVSRQTAQFQNKVESSHCEVIRNLSGKCPRIDPLPIPNHSSLSQLPSVSNCLVIVSGGPKASPSADVTQ